MTDKATAHQLTSYQQARIDGMAQGFRVEVTPASELTGQALDAWMNAAEDALFDECLKDLGAMRAEREALAATMTWGRT